MAPAPTQEHLGYRMMALEVTDMQSTIDYLKTKGVAIRHWGPRISDSKMTRAEISDPDGHSIELRHWFDRLILDERAMHEPPAHGGSDPRHGAGHVANLSSSKVVQTTRVMLPHPGLMGLMPAYAGALGAELVAFYPNSSMASRSAER